MSIKVPPEEAKGGDMELPLKEVDPSAYDKPEYAPPEYAPPDLVASMGKAHTKKGVDPYGPLTDSIKKHAAVKAAVKAASYSAKTPGALEVGFQIDKDLAAQAYILVMTVPEQHLIFKVPHEKLEKPKTAGEKEQFVESYALEVLYHLYPAIADIFSALVD